MYQNSTVRVSTEGKPLSQGKTLTLKGYLFIMEKIGEHDGGRSAAIKVRVVKRAPQNGVAFIKACFTDPPASRKTLPLRRRNGRRETRAAELALALGKAGTNADYGRHEAAQPCRG